MCGCTKDLCLSFSFAVLAHFVTELGHVGVSSEIPQTGDLFQMSELDEEHTNTFRKCKKTFHSNILKANLLKIILIVSIDIVSKSFSISKVCRFGIFCLKVNVNSALLKILRKEIHSRCAGVNRVTVRFSMYFAYSKCD